MAPAPSLAGRLSLLLAAAYLASVAFADSFLTAELADAAVQRLAAMALRGGW